MICNINPEELNKVYSLYRQCLEALGINCTLGCDAPEHEQHTKSGEQFFAEGELKEMIGEQPVIFDIGGNEGRYASMISAIFPKGKLYSFEPHPKSYDRLTQRGVDGEFFQIAVGAEDKPCTLYERVDHPDGSEMASVHEKVITEFHGVDSIKINVEMKTIDTIMKEESIDCIDFLKIDVEGHELAVVQGAREAINKGQIKVIQYEFNHPNIESKAFMRDFRGELKDYNFYRMLEKGAIPVHDHPIFQEIFGYQNIIAIRKDIDE
jgi:FkbM family methyltransferase